MGQVLSRIQRQVYKFNAENRAHKVISQDKPIAAPKHETTVKIIERLRAERPEFLEQQAQKQAELVDRLKHVFVTSGEKKIDAALQTSRPLPQLRKQTGAPDYGYVEPEIIPEGRFTLSQALKFIADHQSDPATYTAAVIAKEYKLENDKTEAILEHFKAFQLFVPEDKKKQLSRSWLRQLTPGAGETDKDK